ncbi:MAG: diguanylate cyclase [Lachnospiraceae bacterium]|nr:diguanylate cyclase [Lachnospiraceae bacterium]
MNFKSCRRYCSINCVFIVLQFIITIWLGFIAIMMCRDELHKMIILATALLVYMIVTIVFVVYNFMSAFSVNHELKHVREIAYSDKMTSLGNRRAYDEYVNLLDERIAKGDVDDNLLILMMDVNGLKKTNDILGHAAGDELLVGSAECIVKAFGGYGRCFRFGGDEFIVIAVMEEDIFAKRKEELVRNLANWQGEHINGIAISIGMVRQKDYPNATIEEIISIADQKMYTEKQHYYASQLANIHLENDVVDKLHFAEDFELSKYTMPVIQQMAEVLPGGFFIYKESENRELLYFNRMILEIYGCDTKDEFMKLTGGTFEGMVHPDDFAEIQESIDEQIADENGENMDHVIYRIIRKDGEVRRIDDYGHFSHTEDYGDVYYVFVNDITDMK